MFAVVICCSVNPQLELPPPPQPPPAHFAMTIQLPAMCLIGFGKFIQRLYGPMHIAVPIDAVSVGAT